MENLPEGSPVGESLPQPGGARNRLADIQESLPESSKDYHATDENLGKLCPRFPAMIAVDYERVFAEQAKKRQAHGMTAPGKALMENFPEASAPDVRPPATDESLKESLPEGSQASDEAGDLFNVSGRTVRDAHNAP